MVYYDLLMQTLGTHNKALLVQNKDKVIKAYKKLCASADFKKTTSGGLQMKSSIARRTELWNGLLKKALA
ncbi:hypothetical protein AX760_05700 [Pararhizobium antarcticum]|uniref:Uncharacterized protein n=2 Tax=Pararhizobium antarcticum TaxID=1798805 RepID=A0A657LPS9_9HYPH|nr:hypothetical protein AX760_05700 [Pararhizobium antarcticum]